jgi:hypothetical protein
MFITVGIVATLAIAGYIGYKNKKHVFWNGVKLYDSIKEYCSQFQDNFRLQQLLVYTGDKYFNIHVANWKDIPFYLIGLCDENSTKHTCVEIGMTYILNDKTYCSIYHLKQDSEGVDLMLDDIIKLRKYNNKPNNKNRNKIPINFILSATYFNGFEEIEVTELLQMFDTDGAFYKTNNILTFDDILKWGNKLTLCNLYEKNDNLDSNSKHKYIEIVNLLGEFEKFTPNDILKFDT